VIIIPVYNAEKYLERAVTSVLKQSIGFENLELIIVDDNSSDDTRKIIETYSKKYDNIVPIYRNENSGGAGIPRNIGMKKVTSEFIMFLDGDDTYKSDVCETVYGAIKSEDIDFIWYKYQTVYNDDYIEDKIFKDNPFLDNLKTNDGIFRYTPKKLNKNNKKFLEIMQNGAYVWDKIFKKEFLVKNNIEFGEYAIEDSYFMASVFIKSVHWNLLNNYIGYNYIIRRDNFTMTSSKKNIESLLKGTNFLYDYLKKESPDLINLALCNLPWIVKLNLNCKMKPYEQKEILQKYKKLFKGYKLNTRNSTMSLRLNIAYNILTKLVSSNYIIAIVLSRIYIGIEDKLSKIRTNNIVRKIFFK
jgi:glycosyltransferase involved in cell wall biosynthesis